MFTALTPTGCRSRRESTDIQKRTNLDCGVLCHTFMSLTALLWRLLIISSNQRPLCSIHTIISPCSSQVVSFEYVAFQVTHTCRWSWLARASSSEHQTWLAVKTMTTQLVYVLSGLESRRPCYAHTPDGRSQRVTICCTGAIFLCQPSPLHGSTAVPIFKC